MNSKGKARFDGPRSTFGVSSAIPQKSRRGVRPHNDHTGTVHRFGRGSPIKPVVVVPIHKPLPSATELVSLRQCGKLLARRDIKILAPEGLDLVEYQSLLPGAGELRVAPHWMESRQAYNRMMISPLVFEALQGYSHMLVHEADSIVLRDELDYWCVQPYDYIGAPWFQGYSDAQPASPILGVGNFGLSLHRLETAQRIMSSCRRWYSYKQVAKDFVRGCQGRTFRFRQGIRGLFASGQARDAWRLYAGNCDAFWCYVVPEVYRPFKLAPPEAAARFAWEVLPKRCLEMCKGQLPFGIHAWARYDFRFLRPYFQAFEIDLKEVDIHQAEAV